MARGTLEDVEDMLEKLGKRGGERFTDSIIKGVRFARKVSVPLEATGKR